MSNRVMLAAAYGLTLLLAAGPASAQGASPPSVQPATGFFPCTAGYSDSSRRECIATAMDAVLAVRARQWLITVNPAEAGCIGKDAAMCIASLGRTLRLSTAAYDKVELPTRAILDINGKPVSKRISVRATLPGSAPDSEPIDVSLYLYDGLHVTTLDFMLTRPTLTARTEDEWASTGVYDFAAGALGPQCVGSDRLAFYRRVDALQKKGDYRQSISDSLSDPGVTRTSMASEPICGAAMTIVNGSGISASTGSYSGSMLEFGEDLTRRPAPPAPKIAAAPAPAGTPTPPTLAALQKGAEDSAARGGFGFTYAPTPMGALIMAVAEGSPAAAAGLKPGEMILALDGVTLKGLASGQAVQDVMTHNTAASVTLSVEGAGEVRMTKAH
jgi:hypothetical protein